MPLFSSESVSGTAALSVAGVFVIAVLVPAIVGYVEWSSDANLAQFMGLKTEVAAATSGPVLPLQGRTGCPQGNKMLPSTLAPLD